MARRGDVVEHPSVVYGPNDVQALLPQVLTASGSFLSPSTENPEQPSRRLKRVGKAQAWQYDAEHWMTCIGEVWYAFNYVGSQIAKGQWLIGWVDEDGDLVRARDDKGMPVKGVDPGLLEIAQQALDRLSGPGGHADWSRPMGTFLASVAEGWLIGYHVNDDGEPVPEYGDDDQPNPDAVEECWEAYSPTCVDKVKGDDERWRFKVKRTAEGDYETLPADSVGVQIFRRGRFPDDADGAMLALNDVCEDLQLLQRAVRGSALSRTHAGLLLIPREGLGAPMPTASLVMGGPGFDGQGPPANPIVTEIVAGLSTPARDPGSAASLVPTPITTASEHIEKWRHLPLSRDIDPQLADERQELLRRFAQGNDLPPEIILGMADLNHWTAWQVGEDAWRHVEPTVIILRDGLTTGYLWPMMRSALAGEPDALGEVEPLTPEQRAALKRFRLYFDPTAVVTNPDRAEDALEAFDRGGISYAALRRYLKFPESDAPAPDELAARAALGFAAKPGTPAAVAVSPGPAQSTPPSAAAAVVTAAGLPSPGGLSDLATTLGALDQDHLRRTIDLTEAAVHEATAQAGAQLRSRAQKDPVLRAMLSGRRACEVGWVIGPKAAMGLFATDDGDGDPIEALFAAAVAAMLVKYRDITGTTLDDFARAVQRHTGEPLADYEIAVQAADVTASEAVLSQGVTDLARARLFDQTAHAIATTGEVPSGITVPTSVARRATARAGGAHVSGGVDPLSHHEGGIATGPERLDVLNRRGIVKSGIVWQYGPGGRKHPFEPHADLDGGEFTGPDDPDLDVAPWGLAFPGDHSGCLCTWTLVFQPDTGSDSGIEAIDEE